MNEVMRDNDIMLATMQKPNATNVDLLKNNITLDNTQLLDKDLYKQLPSIQKAFTLDGAFNEELFNATYALAEQKYKSMEEDQLMANLIDGLEYSKTSFFRKPTDKVASTAYKGVNFENPLQQAIGVEGINVKSEATKTEKEVAQSHTIWDPVNQKWLKDTAESRSIFEKAFGEPLMYAKYTKDGYQENPITKEVGYHAAGEYIKDENGSYFTQLAKGVDLTNQTEIVKLQDILSDEDSMWNKIDFYDADSKDKSIAGTVMKTLISTIPYFLPYIGPVYTAASILVGLGENLPQIAKSFDWSSNGDAFTDGCNKVINWFNKLSPSTSQYGQEHFWSVESLGNLTADMVGQLYQQRGLASLSKYFVKTAKTTKELEALSQLDQYKYLKAAAEEQAKIAQALSMGYMSLVQAGDVYNDALNAGYSRGTAGLATLLSTGAFYGIMNFNELRGLSTWMLDSGTGYDRAFLNVPIAQLAKKNVRSRAALEDLNKLYKTGDVKFASKMRDYWLKFWDKVDDAVRIGGGSMWSNALTEGVEEVTEEAVQDGVKGLIDGLNYLGYTAGNWGNENASFGGWSNVFSPQGAERYLETFFGGALGGAMFNVTQNKIKPFTDSLFGMEPEVKKPVNYDLIDIALRGEGEQYNQEVDRAVRFISDRELDLNNPEDRKIYNAREAIASTLKYEMKTAQDLVDSIMAGADFSTLPEDFQEQVKLFFKPLVSSTGAIDYINGKFQHNVHALVNAISKARDIEKQIDENKEGLDIEKARQDLKVAKEEIKALREGVTGFFTGRSYIDTHDEANYLIYKDVFNKFFFTVDPEDNSKVTSILSDKEYYDNIMKKEGGKEFKDLIDESTDPDVLTKQKVHQERELFARLLKDGFSESLYEQLPKINQAFKAMTKLIGSDLVAYAQDARKRTVVSNAIKRMQQDRDMLREQLESEQWMSFLEPERKAKYDSASEEERAKMAKEDKAELERQIIESFSIPRLMELIRQDPNAFSLADRYNIDYTSILEANKVITLDKNLSEDQKRIISTLINSEFANVPLSRLTKETTLIILDNIQAKLGSDTNYFGQKFKLESVNEDGSVNPQLLTFDVNMDNFTEDIQFIKLNDLKDFINTAEGGVNENLISEDIYNYLLEQYKQLDAEFLSQFAGLDGDVDEAIKQYNENPNQDTKKEVITLFKYACGDPDFLLAVVLKLNIEVDPNLSPSEIVSRQTQAIEAALNTNLKAADFVSQTGNRGRIENNFTRAIDKIAFALGNDAVTTRKISDQITGWAREIRENEGKSVNSGITLDDLKHIQEVLQVFLTVAKTMAPVNVEGVEYEGILKRNKNFAKALGQEDTSDYQIISSEEYELFASVVGEMQNKVSTLRSVYKNVEEEQSKQFEDVREKMVRAEFKLFRYHVSKKDDPLYIEELAKQIEEEGDQEFSQEEQLTKMILYRQAVYNKLQSESFGGELFEQNYLSQVNNRQEAIVNFLMDTYGKDHGKWRNDIFYYGDSAIDANNQEDGNDTFASYFLADIIGLAGLDSKYTPKKIQESIEKAFEEAGMYPRQDLIYDIELAILGILAKGIYAIYGNKLEEAYSSTERAALKQYVTNLIRIPGPAGSGKTAMYRLLIKSLETLGFDKQTVISAQQDYKIKNIESDLQDVKFNKVEYKGFYSLISGLKEKGLAYRALESRIFEQLDSLFKDIVQDGTKDTKKTVDFDPKDPSKGKIEYTYDSKSHSIKVALSGVVGFDLSIDVPVSIDQNGMPSHEIHNAKITVNKFEDTLDVSTDLKDGLLVIDECTNLSPYEWLLLKHLAGKHNFNILATGDQYQRGYQYKYGKKTTYIGDENILGLNLPALASVHRALSSATRYNEGAIRNIADIALAESSLNSHEGLADFTFKNSKKIKEELAALKLLYTLDNDTYGLLGADVTNSEAEFNKALDSIKKKDMSILVITSSPEDSAKVTSILDSKGFTNYKAVPIEDIQGSEADYAIAYNIPSTTGSNDKKVADLKEIYTLVTRGRYGFISFGTNKDIFGFNKVSSTTDTPVVLINSRRSSNDPGNQWLDKWKSALSKVEDIKEKPKKPTKQVPIPEGESFQPNPEQVDGTEEEQRLKTTTNISKAFGEGAQWLILRQYGYHLGISLNNIAEIEQTQGISQENTNLLLQKPYVKGTSFEAFLQLLSGTETGYSKDEGLLKELANRAAQNNSDNYIEAYVEFINTLREASQNGQVHAYSFLYTKKTITADPKDSPDVAYLKVNDDPDQAGDLRTVGIPTFDSNGAQSGHIILGVIGYEKDANGNPSVSENSWYDNFLKGKVQGLQIKFVVENPEAVAAHLKNLSNYAFNAGFDNEAVKNSMATHTGPVVRLTNLRDFKIKSDWLGNIHAKRVALGRAAWEEFLHLGYEVIQGESFDINPDNGQELARFKQWYDRFRFGKLSKEGLELFTSLLQHKGTFVVVRPKGTQDAGFPVLIKEVVTWDQFIESSKSNKGAGTNLSGYAATNVLYALAKYTSVEGYENLDYSKVKDLVLDDSKRGQFVEALAKAIAKLNVLGFTDTTKITGALSPVVNCVLLANNYEKYSKTNASLLDAAEFKSSTLMKMLKDIAEDFPYISIAGTNIDSNTIVERIFEPSNNLIDLSLLSDTDPANNKEKPKVTITDNPEPETVGGLTESEFSNLSRNLIRLTNGGNLITPMQRGPMIREAAALIQKVANSDLSKMVNGTQKTLAEVMHDTAVVLMGISRSFRETDTTSRLIKDLYTKSKIENQELQKFCKLV